MQKKKKQAAVKERYHVPYKRVKDAISKFSSKFREPVPIACVAESFRTDLTHEEQRDLMEQSLLFGPMSVLRNLFQKKKRVRVLIRGAAQIKSHLTGLLRAFDKHCNLILIDVHETRRKTATNEGSTPVKYRRQLFVRGENVVVVSAARAAN